MGNMGIIGAFIKLVSEDGNSEKKPSVKFSIERGLGVFARPTTRME